MQLLLHIPCRTNIKKFALCFQGPKFFNSLNIEIQNVGTFSLFVMTFWELRWNASSVVIPSMLTLGVSASTSNSSQEGTNIESGSN